MNGTQQTYSNINKGSRWVDNSFEWAEIILREPIPVSQIKNLVISTTFSGGVDGDNWDMNWLVVTMVIGSLGTILLQWAGAKRFTGDDKTLTIPILHTMRDLAQLSGPLLGRTNTYSLMAILGKLRRPPPGSEYYVGAPFTLRVALRLYAV